MGCKFKWSKGGVFANGWLDEQPEVDTSSLSAVLCQMLTTSQHSVDTMSVVEVAGPSGVLCLAIQSYSRWLKESVQIIPEFEITDEHVEWFRTNGLPQGENVWEMIGGDHVQQGRQ